jgi:hypothetical protein
MSRCVDARNGVTRPGSCARREELVLRAEQQHVAEREVDRAAHQQRVDAVARERHRGLGDVGDARDDLDVALAGREPVLVLEGEAVALAEQEAVDALELEEEVRGAAGDAHDAGAVLERLRVDAAVDRRHGLEEERGEHLAEAVVALAPGRRPQRARPVEVGVDQRAAVDAEAA